MYTLINGLICTASNYMNCHQRLTDFMSLATPMRMVANAPKRGHLLALNRNEPLDRGKMKKSLYLYTILMLSQLFLLFIVI